MQRDFSLGYILRHIDLAGRHTYIESISCIEEKKEEKYIFYFTDDPHKAITFNCGNVAEHWSGLCFLKEGKKCIVEIAKLVFFENKEEKYE